jgi:hypothetical protein
LAKLPVIFLLKGVSGWMQIFLLLNIFVQVGLNFWALILSDQNLISHDWPEFQIKKIHQQCVQNITPKTKATLNYLVFCQEYCLVILQAWSLFCLSIWAFFQPKIVKTEA